MTAEKNTLKRDAILQTLQICLWGLLTLVLAVLLVLEVASELGGEEITVQETVTVSSSRLTPYDSLYSSHITGRIVNRSGKGVTVETMRLVVRAADGAERTVVVDRFVIPARSTYIVDQRFDGGSLFDTVVRVELTVDGETLTLVNVAENERTLFGGAPLLYAALLVPAVWMLVRASKKRYYIFQESKMVG